MLIGERKTGCSNTIFMGKKSVVWLYFLDKFNVNRNHHHINNIMILNTKNIYCDFAFKFSSNTIHLTMVSL